MVILSVLFHGEKIVALPALAMAISVIFFSKCLLSHRKKQLSNSTEISIEITECHGYLFELVISIRFIRIRDCTFYKWG